MRIGSYQLKNRILLAPMAGITDQPFRRLCAYYGAGLTFSEMMSTNPQVWHTEKSKLRLAHSTYTHLRDHETTCRIAYAD